MSNPKRYNITLAWLEQARDFINRAAEQVRTDRQPRDPDFETEIRDLAAQCQTMETKLHEFECVQWERRFP